MTPVVTRSVSEEVLFTSSRITSLTLRVRMISGIFSLAACSPPFPAPQSSFPDPALRVKWWSSRSCVDSSPNQGPVSASSMPSRSLSRWIVLLVATVLVPGGGDLSAQPRTKAVKRARDVSIYRKQYLDRREKYFAALEALARDCEAKNLPDAAAEIRRLAEPVDSSELRLAPLPRSVQPPLAADLSPAERQWRTQWQHQRESYAKDLYALSRRALQSEHIGFALDLVCEVAHIDPDNLNARRILGFSRNGDEWLSGFERKMQKEKMVWHERFGWILRDHVERYERGERYFQNKWISEEKEVAIRHDFVNCWEIRTEHYRVKTNHSHEKGVELAKKLEDYHALFFQMMAGFFNSPEQVKKLIEGSAARPNTTPKQNEVH